MKRIVLLVALAILTQFGFGQIVPSSCTPHDSIIGKYNADADRLALRKIYQYNLTYSDSIVIPETHADTMLNALIAVYNATALPARDTVVAMYDIHSLPNRGLNSFTVSADSNLTWMQQLRNGVLPTGNSTIDSLAYLYNLNPIDYSTHFGLLEYHTVVFQTDSNYNIQPLSDIYETISGVYFSDPDAWGGDGNDITSTIYTDHVELIYSVGWGDCLSGCISRRYWIFKIYYDCSVEFVNSYGTPLPVTASDELDETTPVRIFPNPFDSHLDFKGVNSNDEYFIYNIAGQELIRGHFNKNRIQNLDWLQAGLYLIEIKTDKRSTTHKLIKK